MFEWQGLEQVGFRAPDFELEDLSKESLWSSNVTSASHVLGDPNSIDRLALPGTMFDDRALEE